MAAAKPPEAALPPSDPDAAAIAALLVRGDYAGARRRARDLLVGSPTPEAREAAEQALRATGVDPVAILIAAVCLAAIVASWVLTVE